MIQIVLLENGIRVANVDYPNNHLVFGIDRTIIIEIYDSGKKVVSAPYTEFIDENGQLFLTPESVISYLELSYRPAASESDLNAEIAAREAGDVLLQDNIDTEASVREAADTALDNRTLILENNEYKVTYYEVISGTSGSLTLPGGATINAGEFGLSGNAILSKIDGSNKPTFESPKTSGGVIVTSSLNVSTGAWVTSGTYTDSNVALIYSIKIKAVYYSNLNYNNIIETASVGVVTETDIQTLTNKTIKKRILVVTQSATPSTNIDNADIVQITGQASAITSMTSGLSGTPYDGQMIMWQITDNGTARAITWGASFDSTTGATLPTTTVISTMLRVITQYNSVTSKHECQYVN